MTYLILQILLCLLLAFLLGLILGWWLGRLFLRKSYEAEYVQNNKAKKADSVKPNKKDADATAVGGISPAVQAIDPVNAKPSGYDITEIEGIGKTYGDRLRTIGIKTTADLIAQGGKDKEFRLKVAQTAGVKDIVVDSWVQMADLLRVEGIDGQFAELTNSADIKNVGDLAKANAGDLHKQLVKLNEEGHISPETPTADNVSDWVKLAKGLDSLVS